MAHRPTTSRDHRRPHRSLGRVTPTTAILMLINNRDIRILNPTTGELIRHLQLDPTRTYQPQPKT